MGRLHRGDDAQASEPRDILEAQDLRVLDPEARVLGGDLLECRLVGIERDAISSIADRMRRHLKTRPEGAGGDVTKMRWRCEQEARVAGVITVGLEQRRSPRAQRAIREELDGPDPQVATIERALRSA